MQETLIWEYDAATSETVVLVTAAIRPTASSSKSSLEQPIMLLAATVPDLPDEPLATLDAEVAARLRRFERHDLVVRNGQEAVPAPPSPSIATPAAGKPSRGMQETPTVPPA
jgi:hypothetical protein